VLAFEILAGNFISAPAAERQRLVTATAVNWPVANQGN
jgi:hypothetical protein